MDETIESVRCDPHIGTPSLDECQKYLSRYKQDGRNFNSTPKLKDDLPADISCSDDELSESFEAFLKEKKKKQKAAKEDEESMTNPAEASVYIGTPTVSEARKFFHRNNQSSFNVTTNISSEVDSSFENFLESELAKKQQQ